MKNFKRIIAVFMCAIALFSSIGMKSLAAGVETSPNVKVYDSSGNLIEELDSMDELSKYGINTNARAQKKLIEFFYHIAEGIIIQYVVNGISNAYEYLSNYNITIPTINPGETATVYSLDGNIYNPYPPNSYQGATWQNTNFIVVVN